MARGIYSGTTGAISTNATTAFGPTVAADEQAYILYIGVDVSAAGTTSTASVQDTGGGQTSLTATTAVGHSENYPATSFRDYPGLALAKGLGAQVVTAGGAAATLKLTYIIWVK